MAEAARLSRMT